MLNRYLIKVLSKLKEDTLSLEDLTSNLNLPPERLKEVTKYLESIDSIKIQKDMVKVRKGARVKLAFSLLEQGFALEDVVKELDWEDFEEFSSNLMRKLDFKVRKRFILRKPKREIDLIAEKENYVLAIDCKSWKKAPYLSRFVKAIEDQRERCERLSKEANFKEKRIFPIILSLYEAEVNLVKGVPLVPLYKLRSFLLEFEGYTDKLLSFKS